MFNIDKYSWTFNMTLRIYFPSDTEQIKKIVTRWFLTKLVNDIYRIDWFVLSLFIGLSNKIKNFCREKIFKMSYLDSKKNMARMVKKVADPWFRV